MYSRFKTLQLCSHSLATPEFQNGNSIPQKCAALGKANRKDYLLRTKACVNKI